MKYLLSTSDSRLLSSLSGITAYKSDSDIVNFFREGKEFCSY